MLSSATLDVEYLKYSYSTFALQDPQASTAAFRVSGLDFYRARVTRSFNWAVAYSMSSWKHSCELDVSTLNLLIERQKESLRFLYLGRYASLCDESGSTVGGLEELEVNCMDLDRGDGWWAATMVVGNAESLRHLSLGFSAQIAYEFALERRPKYDEMSVSFGHAVEASLLESHLKRPIQVSLDSLRLCGLDL